MVRWLYGIVLSCLIFISNFQTLLYAVNLQVTTPQQVLTEGTLYLYRDEELYALNNQTEIVEFIPKIGSWHEDDTSWDGWTLGRIAFNNRFVITKRRQAEQQWMGITALNNWMPQEVVLNRPPDTHKGFTSVWLPGDNHIVLSFERTIDHPNGPYSILAGRQLMAADSLEVMNWPYLIDAIGLVNGEGDLGLQWVFDESLHQVDETYAPYVRYNLESGAITSADSPIENAYFSYDRELAFFEEWAWSEHYGLIWEYDDAVFNKSSYLDLPNGFYGWRIGGEQPEKLDLNLSYWHEVILSPDGSRLLGQADSLNQWFVYDLAQNAIIYEYEFPRGLDSTRSTPGVIWVQDSDHIAYTIYENRQSTIHIVSIMTLEEQLFTIDGDISEMIWSA